MATLAELLVGDDSDGYEAYCDSLYNDLKNHWRRAAVRTTLTLAQAGMIGDDSADNTLWHCIAPGAPPTWREIVQTTVPVLDDLPIVKGTDSDVSDRYDEATNDAWIFGVPVSPKRGIIYCRQADVLQNFTALIGASTEVRKHIVDADRDSVFDYGFYGDDIGLLTVPANPLRDNLLGNSEIKVWSQSDANKGLATLVFDNKAGGNFAVGNTITGATSGATGKLMTTDNATTMALGAVSGTFQDNEQIGNGAGVTADVNGDAAIGVKNDPCNNDSTGLWTDDGVNITLAFVAAEYSVTTDAATQRAWIVAAALLRGHIYKIELDIKDGTAASQQIEGYLNDGVAQYGAIKTTVAGWVSVSWTFECATTTAAGLVGFRIPVSLGGNNIQIRRFSCYEITPCCTAANVLAMDGYDRELNFDLYREHWGGNSKEGSFYSLKIVACTAAQAFYFPRIYSAEDYKESWFKQFAGRTITMGLWIKTSAANHFRVGLHDGISDTYSSYHTGSGNYEWIEVTKTMATNTTRFYISFNVALAGNVNGSTIVYVSQPILVFGSSIGAGNYRPRQQEIIWTEKYIPSNLLNAKGGLSDVGWTDLNIEADTDGMIPKGCKALSAITRIRDSGSLADDNGLYLRRNATKGTGFSNNIGGITNDMLHYLPGQMDCDENGDIDYLIAASGAGTFDIDVFYYMAVQVN